MTKLTLLLFGFILTLVSAVPIRCAEQTIDALSFDEEYLLESVSLQEKVDCRDRNVCVVNCPNGKDKYFDLAPLLKYETEGWQNPDSHSTKWYEEYQAYRTVCIKRSGDAVTPETIEFYKIFNKILAPFLGISEKTLDEQVFKGDISQWNFNYEYYIRDLPGLSEEKKAAGTCFAKFVWVMRSFKRLCTVKDHSISEVVAKFKDFDAEYKKRMFQAGGADYSHDPGLYAYLDEYRFQTYGGESNKMKADYYRQLKESVIAPIAQLYMKKSYHDYCKCSGFKKWYDDTMRQSAENLWEQARIDKAKLSVFPKYFETMDAVCKNEQSKPQVRSPKPQTKPLKKPSRKTSKVVKKSRRTFNKVQKAQKGLKKRSKVKKTLRKFSTLLSKEELNDVLDSKQEEESNVFSEVYDSD